MNKELSLSVVICALIHNNKILLIERIKGDYVGLLGLPGGKIEKNEHLSQAATREIFEESGIKAGFRDYLGIVSEHLIEEDDIIAKHFLLHICHLAPKSVEIKSGGEGKLNWFDLTGIERIKNKVIPSDFIIIDKMVKNREKNYYNCVIRKSSGIYVLEKFE
ncbi:NUDIX domain-containing protein [Patescibacteria group bacterium]|nr:NUDIX domain-containing protein [Patescibacteria group bacterium]MBU4057143.1 NUDIX domain-containing protein [Patescibacteria group bacterium]MBU4368187.1 NUDIX domain-containing protein [Patescibacteria group bacterium]